MKFTNYSLQRSGPWLTGLLLMFFLSMGSIARAQVPCYTGFAYTTSGSPYQLSFYDSSYDANGDRPVSWQWSFGDGTASTAQNPSHLYNSNGTYVVCLTATFATGCWTTTCDSIYVGQTLACNASYTFTVSPAGVYDFQNTSIGSGGLTYSWDFGDGTTSTVANPSHTFPAPGTYTVCLSIADGAGCSDTYCTAITINGTGSCQASFTTSTSGNTATFTGNPSPAGAICTWDFGDGSFGTSIGNASLSHTYNANGAYTVCMTVTDSMQACTDTYCDSLYVNGGGAITCSAAFQGAWVAGTMLVNFTDYSVSNDSIVSWAWDFGDGATSNQNNPSHAYATPGNYQICLTITTASGCSSTFCDRVTVGGGGTGCTASFTANVSPSGAVVFTNTSSPLNVLCTWDFGNGGTATSYGSNPVTWQYNANGVYLVCLTITDSMCTDTYCDSIVVGGALGCTANFQYIPDSAGTTVSFYDGSSGGATSWQWSFGDGTASTSQNPVHTYAVTGTYTVCLTITTASGCTDTWCSSVDAQSRCMPQFFAYPDSTMPGTPTMVYQIYSPCGLPSAIFWDFGDGTTDSSGTLNPTHTYATQGWFNVCACVVIGTDTFCDCDSVYAFRLGTGIAEGPVRNGSLQNAPNPFGQATDIQYTLDRQADVTLEVMDLTGRRVQLLDSGSRQPGEHRLRFDAAALAPGLYILHLDADGQSVTRKVAIQR